MASETYLDGSDAEFDKLLFDMKPHVMRLPRKSEKQLAALWIKKLCEPVGYNPVARQTRNQYTRLLLRKLMSGILDGPFSLKPVAGSLPPMTTEETNVSDDASTTVLDKENNLPDWVALELPNTDAFPSSSAPVASFSRTSFDDAQQKFQEATSASRNSLQQRNSETTFSFDRDYSPPPVSRKERQASYHAFEAPLATLNRYIPSETTITTTDYDSDYPVTRKRSSRKFVDGWKDSFPSVSTTTTNWPKDAALQPSTTSTVTSMRDHPSNLKNKILEAAFQEEKLRLQQRHDATVQKILDRKNSEIEDLKIHYRNKTKELEGNLERLEKKLQQSLKDLTQAKEQHSKQLEEVKQHLEKTHTSRINELDHRFRETVGQLEEEKSELEKQHTKAYRELLEDTNNRLQRMEEEYRVQMENNSALTSELESRVVQLSNDAESLSQIREQLENENMQLVAQLEQLQTDLREVKFSNSKMDQTIRQLNEDHDKEIRQLKSKQEASVDFYQKDHQTQITKLTETISDLELHLSQMKQAMDRLEQDKTRQIRELEDEYYQEKNRTEHVYEKKVKSLQQDLEEQQEISNKRIKRTEEALRDKEEEVRSIRKEMEDRSRQSEMALEEFKIEVDRNSNKIYDSLKVEMNKVEADLNKSKQIREKQSKEYQKQIQEERMKYEKQLAELRSLLDSEKSTALQSLNSERERLSHDHIQEVENMRTNLKKEITEMEQRTVERQDKDKRVIHQLEEELQKAREDVIQANQLRKQQLLELGMLREEEKHNIIRDHEAIVGQVKSQYEQRMQELEREHSSALEKVMDKTSTKLKEIEKEYAARSQKSSMTIADLQNTIEQLKMEVERVQHQYQVQLRETEKRSEDEKQLIKQQTSSEYNYLQHDLEQQRQQLRQVEKRLADQEQEYEEKLTSLRSQYEQKLRGTVSVSVRTELEDTISFLKQQVATLQQRCALLQEEIDSPSNAPMAKTASHGDTQCAMYYASPFISNGIRGSASSLPSKDTGL